MSANADAWRRIKALVDEMSALLEELAERDAKLQAELRIEKAAHVSLKLAHADLKREKETLQWGLDHQ